MATQVPIPHDHVLSTALDNREGVLVDLNSKQYYQLNETAMLVWQCLEKRRTREEVVAELRQDYDVSEEMAVAAINTILEGFRSRDLTRD
jgi:hypothetical protein